MFSSPKLPNGTRVSIILICIDLVQSLYAKLNWNLIEFLRNDSSYKNVTRDTKYETHYSLQVLFQTHVYVAPEAPSAKQWRVKPTWVGTYRTLFRAITFQIRYEITYVLHR
jgi:hypothetical protein